VEQGWRWPSKMARKSLCAFICRERGLADASPQATRAGVNWLTWICRSHRLRGPQSHFHKSGFHTPFCPPGVHGTVQVVVSNPFSIRHAERGPFRCRGPEFCFGHQPNRKGPKKFMGSGAETSMKCEDDHSSSGRRRQGNHRSDQEDSVIKFVNQVIWKLSGPATDIHFEPAEDELPFAIDDGILHQTPMPPS